MPLGGRFPHGAVPAHGAGADSPGSRPGLCMCRPLRGLTAELLATARLSAARVRQGMIQKASHTLASADLLLLTPSCRRLRKCSTE